MTTPFRFGHPERRLVGVHQAPAAVPARSWGVVLCYPIGQEYLRADARASQAAAESSGRR